MLSRAALGKGTRSAEVIAEEQGALVESLTANYATIEPFDPDTCPLLSGMAIRLGVLEHDPTSRFTWIRRDEFPIAPNCVLLASGGQGVLVSAQPISLFL